MSARRFLGLAAVAAVLVAAGCGGGSSSGGGSGSTGGSSVKTGGVLRIGTTSYIDSLNPFNYIETQAYNAMIMIFPQLVQYKIGADGKTLEVTGDWAKSWETSQDGKDWTFHLYPNTQWSDGKPMTAEDAAWTFNMTIKYKDSSTAVMAPCLNHAKSAEATDPATLVIHYEKPTGNTLAQLEQCFILPKHVWEPLVGSDGKGLKTYHPEQDVSKLVTGGAFTITQYEKKGTTGFKPDPHYWGKKSVVEGIALTFYTNSDSMIADLKTGKVDWVDQVPFTAVKAVKAIPGVKVNAVPGAETTNITWNSNPRKPKHRELLDPQVKRALSMCVDRQQIIDIVFSGYAQTVESLPGHITGSLENPNLGPLKFDCAAGNKALDDLGYKKGADGVRIAPATTGQYAEPAHRMAYEVLMPDSLDFNGQREFDIIQEGFKQAGVALTLKPGGDSGATYALETDDNCDAAKSTGYATFDMAIWDWVGYVDPDFMLSVVTKGQWCSWSDTGWDNPAYDKMYDQQGTTVDPEARKQLVYKMEQIIYDNNLYTQLVNEQFIDAHSTKWDGMLPQLNGYSKEYYTAPHQV
jgi:peptide/nickel transport system substrate-binding protein